MTISRRISKYQSNVRTRIYDDGFKKGFFFRKDNMKPLKPTQDGVLTKYYKQRRSLEISLQGTHAEIQQT